MSDFHLETERLIIRNWCEDDRDLFYLINSDETVMEFFSIRRNRQESDKMMDNLAQNIRRDGFGFTAIKQFSFHLKHSDEKKMLRCTVKSAAFSFNRMDQIKGKTQ